jgi:DNA-binding NarL/FixJ family response regulator
MTPLKTRTPLADDHEMVRNGLRMVLDAQPDLEVIAEARRRGRGGRQRGRPPNEPGVQRRD